MITMIATAPPTRQPDVNDHDDETVGTNTDEVLSAKMDAKYGPRT
jgi:hypothetical protein